MGRRRPRPAADDSGSGSDEEIDLLPARAPVAAAAVVHKNEDEADGFAALGVCPELCAAAKAMGWARPTEVQKQAIPLALEGHDVVGLAETGSGKTGAFAIPVIQDLLNSPGSYLSGVFCLVLAPTRELCHQIGREFERLGEAIRLTVAVLVGGAADVGQQAARLARRPNVVVGSLGRVVDHLENTRGFSLSALRWLVLDEADRMLNDDFEEMLLRVLDAAPRERRSLLFSATMTSRVAKLRAAALKDPRRVEVGKKLQAASGLREYMRLVPLDSKWTLLVALLRLWQGYSAIVFVNRCRDCQLLADALKLLGFSVAVLHGHMEQTKRQAALQSFKAQQKRVLVATEVASRGLDVPHVALVLNFDVPLGCKDYVHRVGRTARAGNAGHAITLVTQYDVEALLKIEAALGRKLEKYTDVSDADCAEVAEKTEGARKEAIQREQQKEQELAEKREKKAVAKAKLLQQRKRFRRK